MAAKKESLEQQYRELEGIRNGGQGEESTPESNIRTNANEETAAEDPNTDCTVEMILAGECAAEPEPCEKDYKYDKDNFDCNQYTATVDEASKQESKFTKALRALESLKS